MSAQIIALRPEFAASVPSKWADELHPWWCPEAGAGCGTHLSQLDGVRATSDPKDLDCDGRAPIASVAAFMGEDGQLGVHLHVMHPKRGESWATFTRAEWAQVAALGERALDLLATDPRMATRPACESA